MKSSDKRRAPRKQHDSVLEIFDADDGLLITGIGRLVDLSSAGMCFSSTHPFQKGDRINARLRLLKEGVLQIAGHVVWARLKTNALVCGVVFDNVKPAVQ